MNPKQNLTEPPPKWVATLRNNLNKKEMIQVTTWGDTLTTAAAKIAGHYPQINWSNYSLICILQEGAFLHMLNHSPAKLDASFAKKI